MLPQYPTLHLFQIKVALKGSFDSSRVILSHYFKVLFDSNVFSGL